MVRAIVLAAGASSRMGRPKAVLPLSDRGNTFLLRIVRTLAAAGLPEIVVVTGAVTDEVRQAAGKADRRVRFVHNPQWETGQLSSLLAGLDAPPLGSNPVEAVLMTLVDVPLISSETVSRVLATWRATHAAIVRPARNGEHGHPVIFDRRLFHELHTADPHVGAKAVVRAHAHEIVNVPVDDAGAFLDVDTGDDFARLSKSPRS